MSSGPFWAWHSTLSPRERAGGEGAWSVRQPWGTLTLTLSQRERGHQSIANKVLWFCTRDAVEYQRSAAPAPLLP